MNRGGLFVWFVSPVGLGTIAYVWLFMLGFNVKVMVTYSNRGCLFFQEWGNLTTSLPGRVHLGNVTNIDYEVPLVHKGCFLHEPAWM